MGNPVAATDPNGDNLTYTLSGADAGSFEIMAASGQIMVGDMTDLDREDKNTYMVTVTATDSYGASATSMVTIHVTNVDEPPVIMEGGLAISGAAAVDYDENDTGPVASRYTLAGPDSASATWSPLEGDDADDFTNRSGVLVFNSPPDYENPADMDGDNVYMVTLVATDGTNTARKSVTVTVTDMDDSMVTPMPGGTLLDRYDDNDDGMINQAEVEEALDDYFFGQPPLSQEDVEDVLELYFFP